MESLQILQTEETKVKRYQTSVNMISEADCVSGVALKCNPCRKEYNVLIAKSISKIFFMHGQEYTQDQVLMYLESITETYNYETPETILLFLKKTANGDFGKFYGKINIGQLREWFAEFLQQTIIPSRERLNTQAKETYDSSREQIQSPAEYIQKGGSKPVTRYLKELGTK